MFTKCNIVNMATSTVSARLDDDEIAMLDSLSELSGFDRSSLLKSILRKGIEQWRFEIATAKYREGEITLSRAAELAAVSPWDFIARMREEGLELHYDVDDLATDLEHLAARD